MSVRLTAALLLLSSYCSAQIEGQRVPTKFDKFISKEKIQWAAYANNTLSFDTYNFSDELYKRFQKGEIKISLPLSRDSLMAGNNIIYLNRKDLELRSFAPGNYDNSKKPTNRVDSNSSSVINVAEILYVENGKLYSYIPWISPRISVYTSSDRFIGTSEYFSSCINPKYNFKSSKRDNVIFIRTTKRKILIDSLPRIDMLKQLYGVNMLEAIWKDLLNDKNEFTNLRDGHKVSLKDLERYTYSNTLSIPVYDSEGRITAQQTYSEPISPSLFQQIEITQNWYYNYTKNIIVNNITEVTLFLINKGASDNDQLMPVLKITFK